MILHQIDLRGFRGDEAAWRQRLPRPVDEQDRSSAAVAEILSDVRTHGDEALRRLTARFDGVDLDRLQVPPAEALAALSRLPADWRRALEVAHERLVAYNEHEAQPAPPPFELDGVTVEHLIRPMARAGCYAPGGRARYPSTVLMCAVAARVAGVPEVVLCVPPGPDGRLDDSVLAAAAIAGVDEIYSVGGAQAIAAMAFGTESIPAVEVIVGPGNRYVAEAKRQVSGVVGVASAFAGPSEVVVIAGEDADPALVAIDLVVQAEHGPDGLAWLVTWSAAMADAVDAAVAGIVENSPRRTDLEATLGSGGYTVLVDGPGEACQVANVVAPEHLELMVDDPEALLDAISAAGAIFLGPSSPASMGDYLAGPSHVLPTNRSARFSSALRVDDFRRHIHAVRVRPEAIESLGGHVEVLATVEGLPAHADSIARRRTS